MSDANDCVWVNQDLKDFKRYSKLGRVLAGTKLFVDDEIDYCVDGGRYGNNCGNGYIVRREGDQVPFFISTELVMDVDPETPCWICERELGTDDLAVKLDGRHAHESCKKEFKRHLANGDEAWLAKSRVKVECSESE